MAYDHSQTYRSFKLRNIPHLLRIRKIKSVLSKFTTGNVNSYADFGCSTAYLTNLVAGHIGATDVYGFDHSQEHLDAGKGKYPDITFAAVDLNKEEPADKTFDFVTCFETFEHVGELQNAVMHVESAISKGGSALFVVPLESGFRGTIKFLLKTIIYRYKLNELDEAAGFYKTYLGSLMKGEQMSKYRRPARSHWGTHFGFEAKDVDAILATNKCDFKAFNAGFNRFYLIRK